MYDNQHYWYVKATESELKSKLQNIPGALRMTFSATCAHHAYEVIVKRLEPPESGPFGSILQLLENFWDPPRSGTIGGRGGSPRGGPSRST